MTEHIVAKHTKNVFKAWNDTSHSLGHRISEIIIEIIIIVFAVTLSLYLERWREQQRDREVEKQFLIGLKNDLQNDISQEVEDSTSYMAIHSTWGHLRDLSYTKGKLSEDSLGQYIKDLGRTVSLVQNDSRFEALKSSGELGVIEDTALEEKILDLYQYRMKILHASTEYMNQMKEYHIFPFLLENIHIDATGHSNIADVVRLPTMQNYLLLGQSTGEIVGRYHDCMAESRAIIRAIDRQYPAPKQNPPKKSPPQKKK